MPKQEFTIMDVMGVVAVWCCFFLMIGVITVTCVNFYCIHQRDDVTVLEKWGRRKRLGVRLGVHHRDVIDHQLSLDKFKADKLDH